MKYNTESDNLVIKEYGRHVHDLVQYALTIEDKEKRNRIALGIIQLMGQMNPHLRNIDEFKHKLWDHLFLISDLKLDVDSPYPKPTRESTAAILAPGKVEYPQTRIKVRHYGKNVMTMIKNASEETDLEKQKGYSEVIGNYMKMVYKNWNSEHVTDEQIKLDIELLSNNKLTLEEGSNLDTLAYTKKRRTTPEKTGSKRGSSRSNSNNNNRRGSNTRNRNFKK